MFLVHYLYINPDDAIYNVESHTAVFEFLSQVDLWVANLFDGLETWNLHFSQMREDFLDGADSHHVDDSTAGQWVTVTYFDYTIQDGLSNKKINSKLDYVR